MTLRKAATSSKLGSVADRPTSRTISWVVCGRRRGAVWCRAVNGRRAQGGEQQERWGVQGGEAAAARRCKAR